MRLLLEPEPVADLDALLAAGRAAYGAGLDGIMLASGPALPAPLLAAAALGPALDGLLIAAEVAIGDRHPIEVAEEAVTTDLACGGRLILVCAPAAGAEPNFPEALDLIRTSLAARPFSHPSPRWPVPARLPGNSFGIEQRLRVSPAPARARLEIWGSGGGAAAAIARGLGALVEGPDPAAVYAEAERTLGPALAPALIGAPRARRDRFDRSAALTERLLAGRAAFGQDWAVVTATPDQAAELGVDVRPRVQLEQLPAGLEHLWHDHRDELWPPDLDIAP
jgi:alkanesulfonate monooxygenase SsuD/methylene tetrahydromethanopterin reductase-like flavin-dependent oxidoreductase (luciferase family)